MKYPSYFDTALRLEKLVEQMAGTDAHPTVDEMLELALKALIDTERENDRLTEQFAVAKSSEAAAVQAEQVARTMAHFRMLALIEVTGSETAAQAAIQAQTG